LYKPNINKFINVAKGIETANRLIGTKPANTENFYSVRGWKINIITSNGRNIIKVYLNRIVTPNKTPAARGREIYFSLSERRTNKIDNAKGKLRNPSA
jgi:hypothetical protein